MRYELLYPEIAIGILVLALIVLDLIVGRKKKHWVAYFAAAGVAGTLLFTLFYRDSSGISLWNTVGELYFSFQASGASVAQGFTFDRFAFFFKELFLIITLIVIFLSMDFFKRLTHGRGEVYPLLLCVVLGMMFLVSATELILFFVAVELISIPLYAMAAFKTGNSRTHLSGEAGLKYFLMGASASALLLYGMSLVYAVTGTTYLNEIAKFVTHDVPMIKPALFIGLLFMLGGLAFKIAAAPFHMWAPDVYEGAPTPIVAFLSVAPKIAGIAVLMRLFILFFPALLSNWTLLFAILAASSMIIGNLLALHQENVKRMLAYSGIAQIGYILVGLASAQQGNLTGLEGAVFYLVAYAVTNLTAFGVIIYLTVTTGKGEFVQDFRGLSTRSPWLAFIMLIALLSLAGVPPLVGFMGKFYLFMGAVKSNLVWLAALGALNSVISLFYYLRIAKAMYLEEAPEEEMSSIPLAKKLSVVLWTTLFSVIILGVYPAPLAALSTQLFKLIMPAPLM